MIGAGSEMKKAVDLPGLSPGVESKLYAELWVSIASLLRSYTAIHGLNRSNQATVELGNGEIVVRAGLRWLRLKRSGEKVDWVREDQSSGRLEFTVRGSLKDADGMEEEMDMQAEAWARELMV